MPMEGKKQRMESKKTDLIDKKSNIPWLNIKPTIQKAYGREKTKNGIKKDGFFGQYNQKNKAYGRETTKG